MGFFDETNPYTATPDERVEGFYKVTGQAKYAAEYTVPNLAYAVLVGSTIPAGKIKFLSLDKAKQVEGVLDILTHYHRPEVPAFANEEAIKKSRYTLPILHNDKIYFKGQPIAIVIAETLEDATYAASLIEAQYEEAPYEVDFEKAHLSVALTAAGKDRGDASAWNKAAKIIEQEYTIAAEVHHPMEMHATIAQWVDKDKIKLYDKNQGVNMVQRTLGGLYNIDAKNIEVVSEFVGGGFGSGLKMWPHTVAAVMAAQQVNRPVKLVLTRQQMFNSVGYRPAAWQKIKVGATAAGTLTALHHQAKNGTSVYESHNEGITRVTRLIYKIEHVKTEASIVPLNLSTPTWMRGPGDATGDFAIESALDELSNELGIDPVEFRLKNLALTHHPDNGLPWSTFFLQECVTKGAEMIGWNNRQQKPGAVQEGDWKIGYGMAVGMWNAGRGNASAAMILEKDGTLTVQTAMTDIGTGTGVSMQNMAHEALGLPKQRIKIELGNSNLPPAPSQGGSNGLSSISGAVNAVAKTLQEKLLSYAAALNATYQHAKAEDILLNENGISLRNQASSSISYQDLFTQHNLQNIEVEASSGPGNERQQYAFNSAAAHFTKLKVNTRTGKVKILDHVCVADGGKIVSEKAATNQISGAVVGGIGMALLEELGVDSKRGQLIGDDLAGYHFAVNADAPIIKVAFINKPDPNINPSGAKGLGEVGIIGVAASITNAIYNATGKRMRDLPVTADKVLGR